MSFFFNKSEDDQNLQYDDTAFLHFAISLCVINTIIFVCLAKDEISQFYRPGIKELKKMNIYKQKIQNHERIKNQYYSSWPFLFKVLVIFFSLSISYECFSRLETNDQMIGFDPYEILGVQFQAPVNKIKKAYRKLALQYHPDRNANNPQVAAKFIQISKAYKCLTDQQAKENCQKYGNPDGQASFKVGIGLPRVMISSENQYLVLPAIFLILLVVVPRLFLAWNSKIKMKDESGMEINNYWSIFGCFTPKMNTISCAWAMGSMTELNNMLPTRSLTEAQQKGLKELFLKTNTLDQQEYNRIHYYKYQRIFVFYQYLANQSKDLHVAELFPDLALKLTFFSTYFAKRSLEGKPLFQNPQWIIQFCGLLPLKCVIQYTKQLFNQNLRIADVSSIQFLDLTPQQMQIAKKNPIPNLQNSLLSSQAKIQEFVDKFPQTNRQYIKKQIQALPALSMSVRTLIAEEQVTQVSKGDFPIFQIKIKKSNKSYGYVTTKNHPFLSKQYFHVIFSRASDLLHFQTFCFQGNSQQHISRFQTRFQQVRQINFQVRVVSYCYLNNMQLNMQHKLNVLQQRPQNERVIFHKDDLELQKLPKDFYEQLISMDLENDSDKQLSDGESQDSEDEKPKWEVQQKQKQ